MDEIRTHFSKTVDDYDTVSDKVVMKNNEMHKCLVDAISFEKNKELKILDLGCGTGHGMKLIMKMFPNAIATGIDYSHKMIEKSKKNLSEFLDRVVLVEEDFNKIDLTEKYDVIVSAAAIHNSSHENKQTLFKKIYNALKEDGIFINADFIRAQTDDLNNQYREIYRKFLENNLCREELKIWLKHAFEEDMPMKLSEQFIILKNHGFANVKIVWQFNHEVVYIAKK
ncbi:MAG: class I SAM-dependent methyltransferase [Candidatus Peribacteraceae bacterium]|nr:class I SAM-dependent methyltransferase [Candidatus Peribacteraceae bacterium]